MSALHALTSGGVRGRAALVHVLSRGDLVQPVVELLAASERGSAPAEYCAELLLLVLRGADALPAATRLAERARAEPELLERLGAALDWLLPLAEVAGRPDRVAVLCAVAREHADRAELLPPPLVTALRPLATAAVPPDAAPPVRELRHRYALTQLYSANGLKLTVTVLRRVTEAYGQPAVHAAALAGRVAAAPDAGAGRAGARRRVPGPDAGAAAGGHLPATVDGAGRAGRLRCAGHSARGGGGAADLHTAGGGRHLRGRRSAERLDAHGLRGAADCAGAAHAAALSGSAVGAAAAAGR